MKVQSIVSVLGLFVGLLSGVESAIAQVIPDGSLPTTVTSPDALNFTIYNGARSGGNLFHSFSQLSVPTGGSAFFNNAVDVQNIFARVTGGTASNIDGLIKANGTASLFLLNPSGILFGPSASLNLGGSFIGTTASSIQFADGTALSAISPSSPPLLTMSAPIGLQMGTNPGPITVQGPGNQLFDLIGLGVPSTLNTPAGLQIRANNTLALIGDGVNFSGGVVTTTGGGHLEIGSVSAGNIELKTTPTGWIGDYGAVEQFNDINLAQDSILDASGNNGSIQLQGGNISLTEGSAALIQNLGTQPSGGITVNATGALTLAGNTANGDLGSFIQTVNLSTGQIGDIAISAAELSLQDGARIRTDTLTETAGGNLIANVSGTTEVSGFNRNNPAIYTGFVTFSIGDANAGNITVSTKNLKVLDSGAIISVALFSGNTGSIQVKATEQIEIVGFNPMAFAGSSLSTFTQGSGNANRLVINTSRLVIQGGAVLGSTTVATGSAGSVEINASESIDIQGRGTEGIAAGTVSRITSNAELLSPEIQAAFGLPAIPTGDSGSLTINTPSLRIADEGAVSVKNDGPGFAGNVQINANSLVLNNKGSIVASTASGNGGDIRLNLQNNLLMRHNSLISATAAGSGNGGNITINSPIILGLDNSDIIANAVQGRGGNINITTQGIIGLEFRNTLTPRTDPTNDITASSQFSVSGTVRINNIGTDPNAGLTELPVNLADASQKIATGCTSNQGSQFVATGRGGVPQNPNQQVTSDRTWNDLRDLSAYRDQPHTIAEKPTMQPTLLQASGFQRNADGTIELIASPAAVPSVSVATCSGVAPQTLLTKI